VRLATGVMLVAVAHAASGCGDRARVESGGVEVGDRSAVGDGVVARVGNAVLTRADVTAELERLPRAVRMRFSSTERRADLLERLIDLELLAQEARRLGFDRDPKVIRRVRRALVTELAREVIGERSQVEAIGEEDLVRYFRTNEQRYRGQAAAEGKPPPRTLSDVREQVWNDLVRQRRLDVLEQLASELRGAVQVERHPERLGSTESRASGVRSRSEGG
jgi:hypothetical protein